LKKGNGRVPGIPRRKKKQLGEVYVRKQGGKTKRAGLGSAADRGEKLWPRIAGKKGNDRKERKRNQRDCPIAESEAGNREREKTTEGEANGMDSTVGRGESLVKKEGPEEAAEKKESRGNQQQIL